MNGKTNKSLNGNVLVPIVGHAVKSLMNDGMCLRTYPD